MKKYSLAPVLAALILVCVPRVIAQSRNSASPSDTLPGKHRGAVTALLRDGNGNIFSAGEDGFLELWNGQSAQERYQVSPYAIRAMVLRPGKPQITVVESDGLGLYRISAWDYMTRKNLFTLRFRDAISYINYSASGGFLIVARSGRTGVAFINPETGEVLESPDELSGAVVFAATGRSEKTMICYLSSGILSYWDLDSGHELQRLEVPSNIRSPILFGNNRFLGGFDSQGLLVLDAVTGAILARDTSVYQGSIFIDTPDSAETRGTVQFNCLSPSGGSYMVYRMEINFSGRLTTVNRRMMPASAGEVTCGISENADNIILGTGQGTLWLLGRNGPRAMNTGNPEMIIDTAASSSAIAFISEKSSLGYIPLDYSLLQSGDVLKFEDAGTYTSIVSDLSTAAAYPVSQFLLWQPGAGRSIPLIKTLTGSPKDSSTSQNFLSNLSLRVPLRSAAVMGNSILFLDISGEVSILNLRSGEVTFSYSAAGAVDAAFINENTIILARSAVTGSTPFMIINTTTGETVPLAYPAMVGVRVYRGSGGTIYGAVVNQSGGNVQTSIIRLNTSTSQSPSATQPPAGSSGPARSERLVEYDGEDSSFAMAESGGNLASTLGGGEATLYRNRGSALTQNTTPEVVPLERTAGLPVKIIDGGRWFIVLDGEGTIAWHDNQTGKLLASFRLYPGGWILEKAGATIKGRTSGK